MSEVAIRVEDVSKDFKLTHEKGATLKSLFVNLLKGKKNRTIETQHALKNVSFEIKKGEFFGIVGRNGSGKSTMLKMLAGIYQPTKGKISVEGKLVPFIELGVGFNPELTGRENVYLNGALLGFSRYEIDEFYDEVVEFAELEQFMDKKLKNYSSGMQVRLAFAMAVRAKADVLLIDEVLAVGDADFQRKCFEYFKDLKRNKSTVVFVSHDMGAVREFCDRAALIDNSKLCAIGSTKDVTAEYSRLFIPSDNDIDNTESVSASRWGNRKLEITNCQVEVGEKIRLKVRIKANKPVENVLFGIHITGQDGSEITAMNNRMLQLPDIAGLSNGNKAEITWEILNIFNDGKYRATFTFVDDTAQTLDWWEDAITFQVKRVERSTTAVFPPVKVEIKDL